jgi:membrane protein
MEPVVALIRRIQQSADAIHARYVHAIGAGRKRSNAFDNFWAAKERYGEVLGGRLAAAIAYYGFFAVFALAMVSYATVIRVLGSNPELVQDIDAFLLAYFPKFDTNSIMAASQVVGYVGLVGLVLTGIGWIDAWRSSQRAIWELDQHPGNIFVRRLVDLGMLLGLGLLMVISVAATDALTSLFNWIAGSTTSIWLTGSTIAVTVLVNMVLATALLTALPRLHISPKRLWPSVVVVGVGTTMLNSLGRFLVLHTENNPAYVVVTTSVGVLVYLYLFNQLVLFGAALAATSHRGRFIDLAAGPVPDGSAADRPADPGPADPGADERDEVLKREAAPKRDEDQNRDVPARVGASTRRSAPEKPANQS